MRVYLKGITTSEMRLRYLELMLGEGDLSEKEREELEILAHSSFPSAGVGLDIYRDLGLLSVVRSLQKKGIVEIR